MAAVKAVTVKKHALNMEEERIADVKRTTNCPDIVRDCLHDFRWTRVFLQTLNHALYVSDQPFIDWCWGSYSFRTTIQGVFDISFPNISYTVTEEDDIMKAVFVM